MLYFWPGSKVIGANVVFSPGLEALIFAYCILHPAQNAHSKNIMFASPGPRVLSAAIALFARAKSIQHRY